MVPYGVLIFSFEVTIAETAGCGAGLRTLGFLNKGEAKSLMSESSGNSPVGFWVDPDR